MKRFLHMEDNEDGTVTMTMSMDGEEELSLLIPMNFDEFVGLVTSSDSLSESSNILVNRAVEIPNEI